MPENPLTVSHQAGLHWQTSYQPAEEGKKLITRFDEEISSLTMVTS